MPTVKVWINRTLRRGRWFDGYKSGDPLELATTFNAVGEPVELLENTFAELNRPDPVGFGSLTPEQINLYHRNFPSLSVGDVVELGGVWYQVGKIGFDEINRPIWADLCRLCGEKRIVSDLGICADCAQGDPSQDLGLEEVHCDICGKVYREEDYDGPLDANEAFANDHNGR